MTRNDKILSLCNLNGKGLEIAPSINPILPKSKYKNVETLDYLCKEGLIKKFASHNVNVDKIEDVDFVWDGGGYVKCIGKKDYYDFIIASAVIEHTVDLLGFLNDCMDLLSDGGILSLAIPDKRGTFDFFRPISTIADVIDTSLKHEKRHSVGAFCEFILNYTQRNGRRAWSVFDEAPSDFNLIYTPLFVKQAIDKYKGNDSYSDIHRWIFTKTSFELLIKDLIYLGFLNNTMIERISEVDNYEFFVSLRKTAPPPPRILYGCNANQTAVSAARRVACFTNGQV